MSQHYEILDPPNPCVSPDGHDLLATRTMQSFIPVAVYCIPCGQHATVVVFADAICAECSNITGIQQECDWLCSGCA